MCVFVCSHVCGVQFVFDCDAVCAIHFIYLLIQRQVNFQTAQYKKTKTTTTTTKKTLSFEYSRRFLRQRHLTNARIQIQINLTVILFPLK